MSDDLISRKEALERLRLLKRLNTTEAIQIVISVAEQQINNCKTAFDKEKVTQELKSNMESAQLAQLLVGTDLVQCGGFSYGYYNGVKDAVKIVEKGGIE